MRLALVALLLVVQPITAIAQPSGYEGPPNKRTAARMAYLALQKECPRFVEGQQDLMDYSLHVGTPLSKDVYGEVARTFQATVVEVVTIQLPMRPSFVPVSLVRGDRFFNVLLLRDAKLGGVIFLETPAALWLCEKTLPLGERGLMIRSREIGDALER